MLKKIIQRISAPRVEYQPLIEVRIFKDALLYNLGEYQKRYPKLQFAPVLKSNAYGHGLVQVAKILDGKNSPFFMVDTFFEALTLRRENIKTKVLILGYVRSEQIFNNKLTNCSFGIIDFQQLKNICEKLNKPQNFHLKIDTGMHRQGILEPEISDAIKLIKRNKNFILEGICTHLADADGEQKDFTNSQIAKWNNTVNVFKQSFASIKYFHASNSAGAAYAGSINANVSRLGIGLYGINMSPFEKLDLQPALEMRSIISSVKSIADGDKVGYGITFEAQKPAIVATVPVGYTEGVDRRLSNKGFYKVKNVFCTLAGRVSMNMSSIDVSEVPNVKLEDEVVIISNNQADKNSVENMAKLCDCIPYEILVRIPQYLRRIIL